MDRAVVPMIPKRSGIGYRPPSAASHEQLPHVPGHIRPFGSGGYCLAGVCASGGRGRDLRAGEVGPARLSHEIVRSKSGPASMRSVCLAARRWFAKFAWSRRAARQVACRRGERETLMISPEARNGIQIDRVCSAPICEEIGARLRIRLAGEPTIEVAR
jgi:hypothetical protein